MEECRDKGVCKVLTTRYLFLKDDILVIRIGNSWGNGSMVFRYQGEFILDMQANPLCHKFKAEMRCIYILL